MEDSNEFIRVGVSLRRNGSLVCPHPSFLIDGISKSFSYNKLPQEPLNLTVMKLDGSSFDIEVPKMGTFAQLKQGVEAAFSHLPIEEPGMIVSWPHVWGNFCLSYKGQKLLNDSDHIIRYGIKDGDKMCQSIIPVVKYAIPLDAKTCDLSPDYSINFILSGMFLLT